MKKSLITILCLLALAPFAHADITGANSRWTMNYTDERGNVELGSASTTIVGLTRYNAFPGLVSLCNGDLLALYRGGGNHYGLFDGKIYYATSSDYGVTWGKENLMYQTGHDGTNDVQNPEVMLLPNCQILVTITEYSAINSPGPVYVATGTVDVKDTVTLGTVTQAPMNYGVSDFSVSHAYLMSNGRYLLPEYGFQNATDLESSGVQEFGFNAGGGFDWGYFSTTTAGDASNDYSESNVLEDPYNLGHISVLIRKDTGTNRGYYLATSTDFGKTWSTPSIRVLTPADTPGKPMIQLMPWGGIMYMSRSGPGVSETGYATSYDFMNTWSSIAGLDYYTSVYSSSVIMQNGMIGVAWAYETSSTTAGVNFHSFYPTGDTVRDTIGSNDGISKKQFFYPSARPGKIAQGVNFDGTTDAYIDIPDSHTDASFSVSLWVKIAASGRYLFINKDHNASGFAYELGDSWSAIGNGFEFCSNVSGSNTCAGGVSDSAYVGKWVHLVGTYDGTNRRLYVNGVLKATTPGGAIDYSGNLDITIGQYPTSTFITNGVIDDVWTFPRALSASDVAQMYFSTNQRHPKTI